MSFLDDITPAAIKKINDSIQSTFIDPLNITVTNLDDQNKSIAQHLLSEGITVEQIKHFVDVSRAQLDPFLEEQNLRASIRKEIEAEMAQPKAV